MKHYNITRRIKYFVRDLLCDANNYVWPAN